MKKTIKKLALPVLFLSVVLYVLCNAVSIWCYANIDETRICDTAIILGAAAYENGVSPVFRERLNHGAALYQNGTVKEIIITGGVGKGNTHSDAYIAREYVISLGVPVSDILIEEISTITEQNLENAKDIMEQNGLETALIVSDSLHMKRAMRQASDKGINAYASPTPSSMYKSTGNKIKFAAREVFFYIGYKAANIFP